MVNDPETKEVLDWNPEGTAFQVLQIEPFVQVQLPLYFKHANLSSFVRQLNTYGFSKIDNNSWVFAHPDFLRDVPERLVNIQRKSSHRPAGSGAPDPAGASRHDVPCGSLR